MAQERDQESQFQQARRYLKPGERGRSRCKEVDNCVRNQGMSRPASHPPAKQRGMRGQRIRSCTPTGVQEVMITCSSLLA